VFQLPEHDRNTLLAPFEDDGSVRGSITETAARAYCHPNTVRTGCAKLAEHTGRSTDGPAATGELIAALAGVAVGRRRNLVA